MEWVHNFFRGRILSCSTRLTALYALLQFSMVLRAALAQLVEHRIRNAGVRCSSHLRGTTIPENPDI